MRQTHELPASLVFLTAWTLFFLGFLSAWRRIFNSDVQTLDSELLIVLDSRLGLFLSANDSRVASFRTSLRWSRTVGPWAEGGRIADHESPRRK